MAERDGEEGASISRRRLIQAGSIGAGVAGAAWVAPSVLALDRVAAQASVPCSGRQGFFTWNRAAYTTGMRSGGPGGANQMPTASGWTAHPTYTTATGTTTTGITITYRMTTTSTTYLNTGGAPDGGQGHGVSSANNSATFKSYRVSKIGTTGNGPPLNDALVLLIEFSAPVGCPAIEIGDLDNNLPTSTSGCTTPVATASPYWADGLTVAGYTAAGGGGSVVATQRVSGAGGTNISPSVGQAGPFGAIACQSIAQNSNASNLTIAATGQVRGLRIEYISRYHDTSGNGAQHMALGDISFYY